jgi:hypothetical protein
VFIPEICTSQSLGTVGMRVCSKGKLNKPINIKDGREWYIQV